MGKFAVGDQVMLKHDMGPEMIVVAANPSQGDIGCAWFDNIDHYHEALLPRDALVKLVDTNGEEVEEEG